jgi:uncharacterized protein (DUF1499 family)
MAKPEKRMPWQILLIVALSVPIGGILVLALLSAASRWRPTVGVHEGKLRPLSTMPKGVSSTATDEQHGISPLQFSDSPEEAWARLKQMMADWPRTRILSADDGYLHAECATGVFRFLDDVEFLLDRESRVIHFRACSRVGLGDLGANRRRMERIREAFAAR